MRVRVWCGVVWCVVCVPFTKPSLDYSVKRQELIRWTPRPHCALGSWAAGGRGYCMGLCCWKKAEKTTPSDKTEIWRDGACGAGGG